MLFIILHIRKVPLKVISWREDPCVTCLPHRSASARSLSLPRLAAVVSNKGRMPVLSSFHPGPFSPPCVTLLGEGLLLPLSTFNTCKTMQSRRPWRLPSCSNCWKKRDATLWAWHSPPIRWENFPQCLVAWQVGMDRSPDSHFSGQ